MKYILILFSVILSHQVKAQSEYYTDSTGKTTIFSGSKIISEEGIYDRDSINNSYQSIAVCINDYKRFIYLSDSCVDVQNYELNKYYLEKARECRYQINEYRKVIYRNLNVLKRIIANSDMPIDKKEELLKALE